MPPRLWRAAGIRSLNVRRQSVQALLDQGRLLDGLLLLSELVPAAAGDPVEGPEATGLLGRVYKQAYVDAFLHPDERRGASAGPARSALRAAVRTYQSVYRSAPGVHLWHGINLVACAARAERDGVALATEVDWRGRADEILAAVARREARGPLDTWDLATALEACVARQRTLDALGWAEGYIGSRGADAFELASTLRQLTEVWQLDSRQSGAAALLPILRGALLRRQGGGVELAADDIGRGPDAPKELQAQFGTESARSAAWFRKAFRRTLSVARVLRPGGGHVGTGFLVRGSDLLAGWGDRPVLVTNAHVLSETPPENGIRPQQARVRFSENEAAEDRSLRVGEILWSSPADALDTTVATLREPAAGVPELELGYSSDIEPDAEPKPRLSVIGHPSGRELEISLYDNHLVALEPPYLYYRSLTEHGSSGSPVFDQEWDVVAVHHAADHERGANEGVAVDAIRAELARQHASRRRDLSRSIRGGGRRTAARCRRRPGLATGGDPCTSTVSWPIKRFTESCSTSSLRTSAAGWSIPGRSIARPSARRSRA